MGREAKVKAARRDERDKRASAALAEEEAAAANGNGAEPVEIDPPIGDEPVEQTADAVIVLVRRDGPTATTHVITSGDVRVTEVESLLKLGLAGFRQEKGLGE